MEPAMKDFFTQAGKAVLEIALSTVIAVAADKTLVTDDDKRKKAFDEVKNKLIEQGFKIGTDVTISMINRAIENAIPKAKADGSIPQ
jgi:hypothetical protein